MTSSHNNRTGRATLQDGFTLIEILIVVAIIAILASVVLVGLGSSQKQANDARIFSDLTEVQNALQLYYSDHGGTYPSTDSQWQTVCTNGANTTPFTTTGANGYIPNLAPTYIAALPINPNGCIGGLYKGYIYVSDGTDYKFAADYSAQTGACLASNDSAFVDPARGLPGGADYTGPTDGDFCSVYSPGAAQW
jgi:prepilin-type N-terminal cleavage/methylation domain-containing protein